MQQKNRIRIRKSKRSGSNRKEIISYSISLDSIKKHIVSLPPPEVQEMIRNISKPTTKPITICLSKLYLDKLPSLPKY